MTEIEKEYSGVFAPSDSEDEEESSEISDASQPQEQYKKKAQEQPS